MTVDADRLPSAAEDRLEGPRLVGHRRSPRTRVALDCLLRRTHGSPLTGRTRDVGAGGMCATTSRPLTVDERLTFELALNAEEYVRGKARVLREQDFGVYALRFESLSEEARGRLQELAVSGH